MDCLKDKSFLYMEEIKMVNLLVQSVQTEVKKRVTFPELFDSYGMVQRNSIRKFTVYMGKVRAASNNILSKEEMLSTFKQLDDDVEVLNFNDLSVERQVRVASLLEKYSNVKGASLYTDNFIITYNRNCSRGS